MSCVYPSYAGQTFAYVLLTPWFISLGLFAFNIKRDRETGKWGVEFITYLYSLFLSWGTALVWIVQAAWSITRGNPYCPDQSVYAFPSTPAFCVGSLFVYVVAFSYFWNIVLSEGTWVIILTILVGVPMLFVWFTFNTVYEVLVSVLLGMVTTFVFVGVLRFFVARHIPMLVRQRPWVWFSAINTMSEIHEEES